MASRSPAGKADNLHTKVAVRADREKFLRDSWLADRPELFGRAQELSSAYKALDKSERTSVPAILHIVGEPGIGKTIFMQYVIDEARRQGWLTIATTCHDIQRNTPFIVANRLILRMLQSLGADAARYTSGLEAGLAILHSKMSARLDRHSMPAIEKGRYRETFLRFLDGIGTDHAVLIACDDSQWIDADSRDILNALAANYTAGPLALVYATRDSNDGKRLRASDGTIVLETFDASQSAALARSRYPELTGIALETVIQHGNGNPFEILTLCEQLVEGRDVAEGSHENRVRDIIASRMREMELRDLEFLQICSLLSDPIEYRILFELYTANEVAVLVSGNARPYLTAEGPALRFRHALIADAVRRTIDFDVPLRQRIITALQRQKDPTFSDYERVAEHAKAIGDSELAQNTFFDLSEKAYSQKAWSAAIKACESALEFSAIDSTRFLKFYTQYVYALRSNNEDEKASSVLYDAINKMRVLNVDHGLGVLLSILMATLLTRGRPREAINVYESFFPTLKSDADRSGVIVLAMYVAACAFDDDAFQFGADRLSKIDLNQNRYALAGSHGARSVLLSCQGKHEEASAEIDLAIASADAARRQDDTLAFTKLLLDFRAKGCGAIEEILPAWLGSNRFAGKEHDVGISLRAWIAISRGDWDLGLRLAEEAFLAGATVHAQIQQLTIMAMIGSLTNQASSLDARIQSIFPEMRAWQTTDALLQLAPWYLLRKRDRKLEQQLEPVVKSLAEHPASPIALGFIPFGLALLAQKIGKTSWLKVFVDAPTSRDRCNWASMQWTLARGVALHAMKDQRASDVLSGAAADARKLGTDFFAAYSALRSGTYTHSDMSLLTRLGLAELGRPASHAPHGLTARELEVASLVGDGKSNREIAEELFLSERTIERHLGNVFDKLQIESRTKLMRWYFENVADASGSRR